MNMTGLTIEELKQLDEREDKVEFKEAKRNFPFDGGQRTDPKKKRRCLLGYIVALCNEKGGFLVLGMTDKKPRQVVDTDFAEGEEGALEDKIYEKLQIRVHTEVLYDDEKRVLIIRIPSRPTCRVMKFEGIGLMRTGDSLREMSDDETFDILSEQEPDFSATFCNGLKFEDLDPTAVAELKKRYAQKQGNEAILSLPDRQMLSDLKLLKNNKLTYAALILLGKKDKIYECLPQCRTIIEYRRGKAQIESDAREEIQEPLYIAVDKIWNYVNQPASNPKYHIRRGPYIFDIPYFNEDVIREAVINAITHRDYRLTGSVVIKQYPEEIEISNPGGFPQGVAVENLIEVHSTPRHELLSEVLLKTGLVEKSGQGVDKIFKITLSEGKGMPDYSKSDKFKVCLRIPGMVEDDAFQFLIEEEEQKRDKYQKLGVWDIITLYKIKSGIDLDSRNKKVVQKLLDQELIKKSAADRGAKYIIAEKYFSLVQRTSKEDEAKVSKLPVELKQIKILAVVASPGDELLYEREQEILLHAFRDFDRERVFLDIPDPVNDTLTEIGERLQDGKHDILHITAHGSINENGEGTLSFETEEGEAVEVTGAELAKALDPAPKIVILSACQSALSRPEILSAAKALREAGIESVIGMKKALSHEAVIEFNRAFLLSLLAHKNLEQAFEAGREAIFKNEELRQRQFPDREAPKEYEIPQLLTVDKHLTTAAFSDFRIVAPGRPRSYQFMGARYLERGFIGRRQILRRVYRAVKKGLGAIVLKGPGGIGKSTLTTRAAANLFRQGYDFIVVQGETGIEQILQAISRKAVAKGVSGVDDVFSANTGEKDKLAWYLENYLLKNKVMIIFDNFEENQDETRDGDFRKPRLSEFLSFFRDSLKHSESFLFFSTRYTLPGFDYPDVCKEIPEFSFVEFRKMLLNRDALKNADNDSIKNLWQEIGGNPRALELLDKIAYKEFGSRAFCWAELEELIPGLRKRIIEKRGKGDDFTPLFLGRLLGYLTEGQRSILDAFSIFRIPAPHEALAGCGISSVREDFLRLQDLSLLESTIREKESLYYIHRLTARHLLSKLDPTLKKKYHLQIAEYFERLRTDKGEGYLEYLMEARWHFIQAGEWDRAAELTFTLEDYLTMTGYPQLSLELLTEIQEKEVSKNNRANLHHLIGILQADFGDYDSAIEQYHEAMEIFENTGDISGVSNSLVQIGMIYQYKGDYDTALKQYEKSLQIKEQIGDRKGLSSSLRQIGMIYQYKGDYDAALKQYEMSLDIDKQIGDMKGVSSSSHQIGMIYQYKGDYDAALKQYEKSLEIDEQIGDIKGVSTNLLQVGNIYYTKGDYERALSRYEKSMEIDRKIGDIRGIAETLIGIGNIYLHKGQYDLAFEQYKESLEIKEKIGDIYGLAVSFGQLGKLHFEKEDFLEAFRYFIKAFIIFAKLGSPMDELSREDILAVKEKISVDQYRDILKEFDIPADIFPEITG
ncbi:MAG: tetratricopeptide repeat protein [Candidatus Aminicenantes bacterium]|nr:tetratricopeptide repeat protein [Candidatus Aminicenantes bacterium]